MGEARRSTVMSKALFRFYYHHYDVSGLATHAPATHRINVACNMSLSLPCCYIYRIIWKRFFFAKPGDFLLNPSKVLQLNPAYYLHLLDCSAKFDRYFSCIKISLTRRPFCDLQFNCCAKTKKSTGLHVTKKLVTSIRRFFFKCLLFPAVLWFSGERIQVPGKLGIT